MAVTAILDTLSLRDSSAHNVLPIWIENLSVSPSLSQVLDIPNRILQELNNTNSESVPIYVSAALQLLPNISAEAKDILVACSEHNNPQARRKVAESLSRITSEYPAFALSLADRLLEDTDSSVIALTATYIGGLSRSSGEDFIPRASMILESENQKAIQRIVESGLRDYLSQNPDDPHSLLVKAWINSSEVGRSRVANLIVEQYRVNPDYFMKTCSNLAIVDSKAHSELLQWIEIRNSELSKFLS
jgi:antitoxin component of MazEF toxin-antitoxin module